MVLGVGGIRRFHRSCAASGGLPLCAAFRLSLSAPDRCKVPWHSGCCVTVSWAQAAWLHPSR